VILEVRKGLLQQTKQQLLLQKAATRKSNSKITTEKLETIIHKLPAEPVN
jgi:hypothetical protein